MNEKSKEQLVNLFQALEKASPSSPPKSPEQVRKDIEVHCKIAELRMPPSPKEIEEAVQSVSQSKAINNATGLPFTKEELDAAVFPTISIPCGTEVRVAPRTRTEEIIAVGVGQMKQSAAMRIETHRKLLAHTPTAHQMMFMADLESSEMITETIEGVAPTREHIMHWLSCAGIEDWMKDYQMEQPAYHAVPKPFPATDPFYEYGLMFQTRDRNGRLVISRGRIMGLADLEHSKYYSADFVKEQLKPIETPLFSFFKKLAKKR